jgi:hypothetical protein
VPYFGATADLGPLLRTLLRLRHDLVIIGRVAGAPLPEPFRARLGAPLASVSAAICDYLQANSAALEGRRAPPTRDPVDAALAGYAAEMAALRREGLTRTLRADEVERIFALGFALEQLHQHFEDLDRSVRECAPPRL